MIFLYITIASFVLVFAVDEFATRLQNRRTRPSPPPPQPQPIHSAIHAVGDACEAADWQWPQNVRPIHHRRSQDRPYLRVVPVDQETAAILGRDSAA
jgi:hypothetical protein